MPADCHYHGSLDIDENSGWAQIIHSCDKIPFRNGLSEWPGGGFLCNFISPTGRIGAGSLFNVGGEPADVRANGQSA